MGCEQSTRSNGNILIEMYNSFEQKAPANMATGACRFQYALRSGLCCDKMWQCSDFAHFYSGRTVK